MALACKTSMARLHGHKIRAADEAQLPCTRRLLVMRLQGTVALLAHHEGKLLWQIGSDSLWGCQVAMSVAGETWLLTADLGQDAPPNDDILCVVNRCYPQPQHICAVRGLRLLVLASLQACHQTLGPHLLGLALGLQAGQPWPGACRATST